MRVYLDGFRYDPKSVELKEIIDKNELVPSDLDRCGFVPINFKPLYGVPKITYELTLTFSDGSIKTKLKNFRFIGEQMLYCESLYLG